MIASLLRDNVESTLFGLFVALLLFPFIMFALLDEGDEVKEQVKIAVCTECFMAGANGVPSWDYDETGERAKWLTRYERACQTYGSEPIPTTEDDDEGASYSHWFSYVPCEFCGSTLGGDRHNAVLVMG